MFKEFRSYFIGKVSPIHFFWGAFNLAVTRFFWTLCLIIQDHPTWQDLLYRKAYTHEVSSCGFCQATDGIIEEPVFYSYAYPEPNGFRDFLIQPSEALYHTGMNEFILPYRIC